MISSRFYHQFVQRWAIHCAEASVHPSLRFPLHQVLGRCIAVSSRSSLEAGDELVRIPHTAMLQSCDLDALTRDVFVRTWAGMHRAGFGEEHQLAHDDLEHWLLAMVLAIERSKGRMSFFRPYLRHCLEVPSASSCFARRRPLATVARSVFQGPSQDGEAKMIAHESAWIDALAAAVHDEHARQLTVADYLLSALPTCRQVAAQDLRWGFQRVVSRAHVFSTEASCFMPREYPLSSNALASSSSCCTCLTLPPFFDIINHAESTNVVFLDVPSMTRDPIKGKNRDLLVTARHRLEPGTILTMRYKPVFTSPCTTIDGLRRVDGLRTFLKFGFVPEG